MSAEIHADLSITRGERVSERVPAGLPVLQVIQRSPKGTMARICAVGDIGLSGRAAATATDRGTDILFTELTSFLKDGDIVFGNLESPLAAEIAPAQHFAAPREGATTLQKAGFDIIH